MEGYIKLYRKLLDNPRMWKDKDYLAIWIYLLLNATHADMPAIFRGQNIILKPGQLITGRKAISAKTKIDESKVQRVLKRLEIEQQIEQQTSNENRLISVLNWSMYQISEQQNEHPVNNECTTSEQRVNTNKNVKNVKNERIKDKDIKDVYVPDEKLNQAILDFIKHRKAIKKPMTDRAIELLIKRLDNMTSDRDEQIELLEHAILKGWQTPYPIKDNERRTDNEPRSSTGTNEGGLIREALAAGVSTDFGGF